MAADYRTTQLRDRAIHGLSAKDPRSGWGPRCQATEDLDDCIYNSRQCVFLDNMG
jgi:hypothetical protein